MTPAVYQGTKQPGWQQELEDEESDSDTGLVAETAEMPRKVDYQKQVKQEGEAEQHLQVWLQSMLWWFFRFHPHQLTNQSRRHFVTKMDHNVNGSAIVLRIIVDDVQLCKNCALCFFLLLQQLGLFTYVHHTRGLALKHLFILSSTQLPCAISGIVSGAKCHRTIWRPCWWWWRKRPEWIWTLTMWLTRLWTKVNSFIAR